MADENDWPTMEMAGLNEDDLRKRAKPPPKCGIYFLMRGDDVVYIGQSRISVFKRIGQHQTSDKEFDAYWWMPAPEAVLDELEEHFICKFSPEYNCFQQGDESPLVSGVCAG